MSDKSPITCHVLDAVKGKPAQGITVILYHQLKSPVPDIPDILPIIGKGKTDKDGRCSNLMTPGARLDSGVYRIQFLVEEYFSSQKIETLYPFVEITFNYKYPDQHYHIPLLLSPNSYTTYRGS